jgi:hypothetical protein
MMARYYSGYRPAGLPGPAFADALALVAARSGEKHRRAGLISAAGFMEDLQVVSYLGRLLNARGVEPHLINPSHLRFDSGRACVSDGWGPSELSFVVRFHQAEWLSRRRHAAVAPYLLGGGRTPVVNPGRAMLSESKRFPLVWDDLGMKMPYWRRLLPETRDPREVSWRRDPGWLLKTAFCNTGDTVSSPLTMPPKKWFQAASAAFPAWIAQRRFESRAIDHLWAPCIPHCASTRSRDARGIYGRLSRSPVVTYAAADVAVLVGGMLMTREKSTMRGAGRSSGRMGSQSCSLTCRTQPARSARPPSSKACSRVFLAAMARRRLSWIYRRVSAHK